MSDQSQPNSLQPLFWAASGQCRVTADVTATIGTLQAAGIARTVPDEDADAIDEFLPLSRGLEWMREQSATKLVVDLRLLQLDEATRMRLDQLLEKIARTKVALEVSHRGAPEAKAKEQPRREAGSPKGNGRKARLTRVSPALDELEEIVPRLDRVLVGVIHLIVTLIGWVLFIAAKLQS